MTTIAEAIERARAELFKHGTLTQSPHGGNKRFILGARLEITDFEKDRYPYWTQQDDDWYQDVFVRKDTTLPPEQPQGHILFPYTYAHRGRYHDNGLGYLARFISVVSEFNRTHGHAARLLPATTPDELHHFLHFVGMRMHIENALNLLATEDIYLATLERLSPGSTALRDQLTAQRVDLLQKAIDTIQASPSSTRAIPGSFMYPAHDFAFASPGGVPPYQNYQLFVEGGELVSVHQHRSLDINGGVQLDFNHDIAWGKEAEHQLGIPLRKIVIIANNLHAYEGGDAAVATKTTIKNWLLKVTYGYDTTQISLPELLQRYESKITQVGKVLADE